ncbi:Hypothetical protein LUCI_0846 [Lucifera butyrica]|uniref:Uncharacterized protein n=1 Tax=Lucifera butyrica TaxID=1351585 RepID=A0A498QZK5_9FIRM|nr:hypothetical protein [Lucifera butyrica]VBB05636.1 Hypothetical protein LUCI_0846 [Lucifera butyrica]
MVIDLDERKLRHEIFRELRDYPISPRDQEKIAAKVINIIIKSSKVIK